jgi:ferredoxin
VQAITPSASLLQQVIRHTETGKGKIYISCRKRNGRGDINIYCLASLPWELYVALVLNKVAVVSLSLCEHCEHCERVTALFHKIRETMGNAFYREHFLFSEADADARILSRRAMIGNLKRKGVLTAGQIFFDTVSNESDTLFFRKQLIKKLLSLQNENIGCSWLTPVIRNNCWGCGLCASKCPNRAMTLVETGSRSQLVHIPWRCTRCGLCEQCCPERSIEGWSLLEMSTLYLQKIPVNIEFKYCPECQKAVRPVNGGYFCYYCGNKNAVGKDEV